MPPLLTEALQYAGAFPFLGFALGVVILVAAFSDQVNRRVVRLIRAFRGGKK
ncbi:hypothetical protein LLS1_37710 [Leifsonia sp. LS1]|uniref:hypothetical protein n=1 Tax=Leifsonia sp. LS1 TaxID=2828483 RepID=UPI001CFCB5ED|nr:hypothetical protein [Leifsonia sp. LS1]GIT82102.1 hypothetical protein LLS1_37710 [Leifsonia sp. LS1]